MSRFGRVLRLPWNQPWLFLAAGSVLGALACSTAAPGPRGGDHPSETDPANGDASVGAGGDRGSNGNGGDRGTRPNGNAGRNDDPTLDTLCTGALCLSSPEPGCEDTIYVKSIRSGVAARRILGENTPAPKADGGCGGAKEVIWVPTEDAAPPPPPPPTKETYSCPEGTVRLHVRDIWSSQASPTLDALKDRPSNVAIIDIKANYQKYWAQPDSPGCDWYSVCLPKTTTSVEFQPVGGTSGCTLTQQASGIFDLSKVVAKPDAFVFYKGTNATLKTDYSASPPPVGADAFQLINDASAAPEQCAAGTADTPDPTPDGFVKVHIRWPWGDPNVTGFPGTNCEKKKLGHSTPPYPSSLSIQNFTVCPDLQATLDFQDGNCPWYTALIPLSAWSGTAPLSIQFGLPDWNLQLTSAPVSVPKPSTNEIWIAYSGPPDDAPVQGVACMDYSVKPTSYHVYTKNPGPGYEHCGGGDVKIDPCAPPPPAEYSTVHFRYLWAGQKTFTFFPKPELMPKWMILEVNSVEVTCTREADRPWFNCPVPNSEFREGAVWRAVDKTRLPTEWNTVQERPFATKPGEYWIRWSYGKPDMTSGDFKLYTYYPDGASGDWSSTGNWHDEACAPKPPPTPVKCGYDGWFPYTRTNFAYPFGASLAHVYEDSESVQELLNVLICERYEIWRSKYVVTDDLTCGPDTARVNTDPGPTVSEGQGYGIAISAAVGDKATFTKLWNFVRHYLGQSAKKYCGGLAGWMWDGTKACQPLDQPCDPDKSGDCTGNQDSAFDGDVDIAIGLVYAARQWPEYTEAAVNWLLKMECEVNTVYDGKWNFPTPGDTFDKNCQDYPNGPCTYTAGNNGRVNLSYYPPGYFRVFGDFLATYLSPSFYNEQERKHHREFWYKTAETVYEMYERCYDNKNVNPGLVEDWGRYEAPCSEHADNYNWSRALWRVGIDAAWFGNVLDLPENKPGSSQHYPKKSRMQAKIDNIQAYYNSFYKDNPPEPNANRFSTLCKLITPAGDAKDCDPGFDHNSYFVNTAMTAYVSVFDDDGATTGAIRREALEEAVSATVENDKYYQESIGVYTLLFLTGNFPNPMAVK